MNEYQLFAQPHDELLRMATNLGIADASDLNTAQLVHAITVAQASQEQGLPWAQTPWVVFRPNEQVQTALIHNPADRPVRLGLEAVDPNGVFAIPAEIKDVVLQGRDTLSVPVRFSLSKPTQGFLITHSARYTGGIQIRDEAGRVVGMVELSGTGAGYQTDPCMVSPQSGASIKSIERVDVDLSCDLSATPEVANFHVPFTIEWKVGSGWQHIYGMSSYRSPDLWPDDIDPQSTISVSGPPYPEPFEASRHAVLLTTTEFVLLMYGEPMGKRQESVWIRRRISVGYSAPSEKLQTSTTGPVYISELDRLRSLLVNIEGKLKGPGGGCICTNTALDRFNDPYLRDPGPDGLTKHILDKMQHVLIYIKRDHLPRAYTLPSHTGHVICDEWWDYNPQGDLVLYKMSGMTPMDQSWVGICWAFGVDEHTLLHELYHYSAAHDPGSEEKAEAIATGCFP